MESYSVLIKRSATKELEAAGQRKDRQRIVAGIRSLGDDPRGVHGEQLAGHEDRYRMRVGRYRIVYAISDADRTVTVFRVAHRRDAYR